jgi:hypothetical protein
MEADRGITLFLFLGHIPSKSNYLESTLGLIQYTLNRYQQHYERV